MGQDSRDLFPGVRKGWPQAVSAEIFRNYRLVRRLGGGQFGEVYEAIEVTHGWRRAVKLLRSEHAQDPNLRARFLLEGHATGLIEHPGVVRIFEVSDSNQREGTYFIIMEYLDGESLAARLAAGRLPRLAALRLCRQVAIAMAAAHAAGVIHRDLKPANLMIIKELEVPGGERCKVVDFGLAKIPDGKYPEEATRIDTYLVTELDKAVMGTASYMSPEQCQARRHIDGKTDVYALGAILYEALTGRALFAGPLAAVMVSQVYDAPTPLRQHEPHLPARVDDFVLSMLDKRPALRPSMQAVAERLAEFEQAEGTGAADTFLFTRPIGPDAASDRRSAGPIRAGLWSRLLTVLRGAR